MKFTDMMHKEARRLWAEGVSARKICDRLSCSERVFRRHRDARPADFPARRAAVDLSGEQLETATRMHGEGRLMADIARAIGISEHVMLCVAAKNRDRFPARFGNAPPYSAAELAAMERDWEAGFSHAEIAARLGSGRTAAGVQSRIAGEPERFPKRYRRLPTSLRLAALGMSAPSGLPPVEKHFDFSHRRLDGQATVAFSDALIADGCRFYVGDGSDRDGANMACCGAETLAGKPWCAAHYRVVYHPVKAVAA